MNMPTKSLIAATGVLVASIVFATFNDAPHVLGQTTSSTPTLSSSAISSSSTAPAICGNRMCQPPEYAINDVLGRYWYLIRQRFPSSITQPAPTGLPYDVSLDLNDDGAINIVDIFLFTQFPSSSSSPTRARIQRKILTTVTARVGLPSAQMPTLDFTPSVVNGVQTGSGDVNDVLAVVNVLQNTNYCSQDCGPVSTMCGNGIIEVPSGEQCDDGNWVNTDLCNSICHLRGFESCGNGIVEGSLGEQCDDGNWNNSDACTIFCTTNGIPGTLFVRKPTNSPTSRQLLGGTLSEPVLALSMQAGQEFIDVTDLRITASGTNTFTIDRLELFRENETSPFALATTGGCATADDVPRSTTLQTYCANMDNRQLIVPLNRTLYITVRARMKSDTAGGVSNAKLQFYIDPTATRPTGSQTGSILARGDFSRTVLLGNNADGVNRGEILIQNPIGGGTHYGNSIIIGETNVSVMSKILSIVNDNPHGIQMSGIPSGTNPVGQFKITSANHSNSNNGINRVVLAYAVFNITTRNVGVDPSSIKIYNKNVPSVLNTCSVNGITNDIDMTVTCPLDSINNSDGLTRGMNMGSSETFVLQVNVTNTNTASGPYPPQLKVTMYTPNRVWEEPNSLLMWIDYDAATSNEFKWFDLPTSEVSSTTYVP